MQPGGGDRYRSIDFIDSLLPIKIYYWFRYIPACLKLSMPSYARPAQPPPPRQRNFRAVEPPRRRLSSAAAFPERREYACIPPPHSQPGKKINTKEKPTAALILCANRPCRRDTIMTIYANLCPSLGKRMAFSYVLGLFPAFKKAAKSPPPAPQVGKLNNMILTRHHQSSNFTPSHFITIESPRERHQGRI